MPTTILDHETYQEALQRRYAEESKAEEQMTQNKIICSPLGREQLVALAREAGFTGCLLPEEADNLIGGVFIDDENLAKPLERFAALVAAHEREACAKVCEERGFDPYTEQQCAAVIRARGMDLLTQHSQAIGEYNDYP